MPEDQLDSNINSNPVERMPTQPSAPEESIAIEKKEIPTATQERPVATPIPEIPKQELGQGGLGGESLTKKQQEQHIKEIESIMEKNIEEIYAQMPPDKQKQFKTKGEETAIKIDTLLHKTKINIKKIMNLIKKWLSMIPGVNSFFLEQSSKIKTDEIIKNRKNW